MNDEMLTSKKSKLSAAAWSEFMKRVAVDPVISEETELLVWAIERPPGELVRDQALFEIGFRFALHCLEQGNLTALGSSS